MLVLVAPADKMSADSESLMSMGSVNDDIKLLSSIFFFSFFFFAKNLFGAENRGIQGKRAPLGEKNGPLFSFFFFSGNLMKKAEKKEDIDSF